MKNFLLIAIISIFSLLILYPAFSLPYPGPSYEDLYIVVNHFGPNLSFFYPKLLYYFHQYGTQFASLVFAYKLFEFNSISYFTLNIFLRIAAAITLYYFVSKWSKSILAGFIAGIFFAVNTSSLQSTTRVSLFQIYTAAIFLCIFLDRWFSFHYHPTKRNLYLSALFFFIAIISHPVRMVGTVPLVLAGESYFFIKDYLKKANLTLKLMHPILEMLIILLLMFVTGTLATTPELTSKRLSLNILFISLITGFPPIIMSLWFFISNLIATHEISIYENSSLKLLLLNRLSLFLPILSTVFSAIFLLKKKFLLTFISISVLVFSFALYRSFPSLRWYPQWLAITHIGGALFLISNLLLFFFKDKYPRLAEIGLFGTIIVVANLLFPWLISPQLSGNDQSAFTPIHRYYTIPSIGMGILLGSVFTLCIYYTRENLSDILRSFQSKLNIFKTIRISAYTIVFLIICILVIFLLSFNSITTRNYLISQGQGINTMAIDRFWNQLKPYITNIQTNSVNLVYLEADGSLDKKYIKEMFPRRIAISLRTTTNPPLINFIFDKEDLLNTLKANPNYNLLAFRLKNQSLSDIKEEILSTISKEP